MSQFILYTDGSCIGNPGAGWWWVVVVYTTDHTEDFSRNLVSSPPKRTINHENGSTTYEFHLQWTSPSTTNNQMELQAFIEWIKRVLRYHSLPLPSVSLPSQFSAFDFSESRWSVVEPSSFKPLVVFVSDSQYVKQGIEERMSLWKKNARRSSTNKPIANIDLWCELDVLLWTVQWSCKRVKWHNGTHYNELADQLAKGKLWSS